jgi:hypothetical protein
MDRQRAFAFAQALLSFAESLLQLFGADLAEDENAAGVGISSHHAVRVARGQEL